MVRTTKKRVKAPTRRRTTAKKPATKRKSVKKRTPATTEIKRQLQVYHNPFSNATKQPKIPDGKVGESLGFQTQVVRELIAAQGTSTKGELTILMFPGMNAGAVVVNDVAGNLAYVAPGNKLNILGYTDSNGLNYDGVAGSGGSVVMNDSYANWRIVSQGLRLSLLNPAETDDGWWESARVHIPHDPASFKLFGNNLQKDKTNGVVVPDFLARSLHAGAISLVNENSYRTGTLRDLHKKLFTLHPQKDDHDFVKPRIITTLAAGDMFASGGGADEEVTFTPGSDNAQELIDSAVDFSFDFVVIKIHGRPSGEETRLHANMVCNQEIVFGPDMRESRFHTTTENAMDMDQHIHGIRQTNGSAHEIPP